MRFLTFLSSVALLSSTHVHAQSTKGKCELYNVLTIPATFRDVCVSGTCMKAETFIPDFDFPNDIEGKRAYQETDRVINNYHQNYCGALGSFSAGLFPQGCTSCEQKACDYVSVDGVARGQVEMTLGSDGTPVWRNSNKDTLDRKTGTGIKSITSAESFYKWYHDTPATTRFDSSIILKREKHTQTFSMQQEYFFPLDTRGWQDTQEANDRAQHNFGFTTRIFSEFVYTGGETFTFQGDDDVWVFIDNKLAIDIGGLHPAMCRTILLDEAVNGGTGKVYDCTVNPVVIKAAREGETYTIAGLTKHSQHNLTIFHAERHRDASTFAMSTSIGFNSGDTGGLDYTLPSATGARIYIGTYQFITLGSVESAPDTIYLPIYTGTPFDTPVTITLEFPPSAQTQILCRILQLSPTAIASLKLDEVDRNTITPPLDVNFVKTTANQATWASVTTEADHSATICTANPADKPSWTITVRTTGGGFGYLYCIADSSASYSDYTAEGKARDTNFYRKWVATAITSQAPTTAAPTTLPPTTVAPTTLPPTTEAPTTLPPTTPAPTTLAPTTAAPTTQAPTTEAPTTQAPTTAAPTTVAPIITTQPPTTEAPTAAPTTQTPTTLTPTTETPTTATPTTQTPTTQTPSTAAPTTPAPTTNAPTDAVTTAPPTTTSAPTSGVTTNPPTSTSTPTVTVAPTDATTSTPTNPTTSVPTSTGQPTNNPTDAPTSTPTPTLTPAPTSISITTTSPPTTPVTEAPITEAPPTDEPTEAPIGGGSGVASAVASSEMSMTTKLTIIIPAVVGGLIVVLLAVWAIHHCIKKRNNAVMHTQRTSMEMV